MSNIYDFTLGCAPYREEPPIVMALCRQCGTCLITDEEEDQGLCCDCLDKPVPFAVTPDGHEAAATLPVLYGLQSYPVERASYCQCRAEIAFGDALCTACKPLPLALTQKTMQERFAASGLRPDLDFP